MSNKNATGFWILLIVGILILIMLILGQMMSFIDYEFTVSLGLQESVNKIGEMGVAVNKAFGVGDTLIYMPLLIIGLIGLWNKKKWGIWSMAGAMAITAYWPVVCLFIIFFSNGVQGVNFTDVLSYVVVLTLFTLYGLWGLWYLYKNQNKLTEEL